MEWNQIRHFSQKKSAFVFKLLPISNACLHEQAELQWPAALFNRPFFYSALCLLLIRVCKQQAHRFSTSSKCCQAVRQPEQFHVNGYYLHS